MAKQKTHIFIALVLVLLIIAAVTAWLTSSPSQEEPETDETPAPVSSETPVEPTDTPISTAVPVEPTTAPETPAPAESEIPEPQGTRTLNQSGSFASDTGTNLNIIAEYSITSKDDSTLYVRINVFVNSYSVNIGQRSGTISVNGQPYSFTSSSISYSGDSMKKTQITTALVEVPAEIGETLEIPISVDWNYRGAYSGQEIEHIPAETVVTVNA